MRYASLLAGASLILLGSACGDGGSAGSSTVALSAEQTSRYHDVEQCTRLRAPSPALKLEATIACPNGELCCMEPFGQFDCLDGDGTCGMAGYYDPHSAVISLPDRCSKLFRHEVVHYLLHASGRPDWNDHGAPEFRCG